MSHAATPRLRLVGHDVPDGSDLVEAEARRAVARENRVAARADLDPTDPRWVLAVRTSTQLEGSVLSPERRAAMLRTARQLGMRPFDASLVIAIVQDNARRGQTLPDAAPTLSMVAPVERPARASWVRWLSALGAAIVASAFLIKWIAG